MKDEAVTSEKAKYTSFDTPADSLTKLAGPEVTQALMSLPQGAAIVLVDLIDQDSLERLYMAIEDACGPLLWMGRLTNPFPCHVALETRPFALFESLSHKAARKQFRRLVPGTRWRRICSLRIMPYEGEDHSNKLQVEIMTVGGNIVTCTC